MGSEVASADNHTTHVKDIASATPATLEEIYKFNEYFNAFCRQNAKAKVVVYTGLDIQRQIKIAFQLGCHLIMTCDMIVQDVLVHFEAVNELVGLEMSESLLDDYWIALDSAKQL